MIATKTYKGAGPVSEPTSDRAKRLKRIQDIVAGRTPTQRDADRRLFMSQITDAAKRYDFDRHGWMSALNSTEIFAFWEELMPGSMEGEG